MGTKSLTQLGLGSADLTAIGKLSETGLSQVEIADAVVEGDKLKKGNITAGQVGAYTKAEVDGIIDNIPETDLSDYYNKAQVDSLIGAIPKTDLSDYYNKTEVYNKLESYSKAEVDSLIAEGGADLSDYYTKAQVDSLIDAIPETDLSNYYNKTQVDNLIPDISTKQDTLVSATNIKTINGESVLGSGDLVISGGGAVDLGEYYKKAETYSKVEVDTIIADIPATDLSGYYDKTEVDTKIANIPETDLSEYYNKTEVDSLIDAIPETDLSNYYDKTETYSKVETNSLVDTKIADIPPTDLSGYYNKTETYNKTEVDNIIDNIPETDLSGYYDKTETETLLSNKVDKEVGKGLSTNDFTNTFKQALESNKVQDITTNSVTKKLVVTYTDGTFIDLDLDDVITDVKVEGAVLDATTNVLTISSSVGGADITVDLSVFVTNQTLSNALVGKADKVHSHTTSDITGLDTTLSNKVDKNEAIIGATKTKITYDSNGLVTGGDTLSESDIPTLSQNKITNLTTDLTSKEISANKKTDMETNKLSDTFYPSIKAVYDWAKGLFVTNQALSDALVAKFDLSDVAQGAGSNSSKVMSQKASTEAFYRAGPGVQKAGKVYVQSTEPTENVKEGDIWLKI